MIPGVLVLTKDPKESYNCPSYHPNVSLWQQVITTFHELQGSFGEKRQFLRIYLQKLGELDEYTKSQIIENLTPSDYVQRILRIEVLLLLKCHWKLIEILKLGDEELACIIFKRRWFICHALDVWPSRNIVGNIFLNLSVTAKYKFVKYSTKYVKDEAVIDKLFSVVLEKYGMHLARHLLVACSVDKIKNVMNSEHVAINKRNLVKLFKKSPKLLALFIEKQYFSWRCLDKQYIASIVLSTHPDIFLKYLAYAPLGKRSTMRLLHYDKDLIIKHASFFYESLHLKTVLKFFTVKDGIKFLTNLCRKETNISCGFLEKYLEYFPIRHRFRMFSEIFENCNNISIWNVADKNVLDLALTMFVPIPVEVIDGLGVSSLEDLEDWLSDKDTIVNLLLGDISSLSSLADKAYYAIRLVTISKYYAGSTDILRKIILHFYSNLRTVEEQQVKYFFLRSLKDHYDLTKLDLNIWNTIAEIACQTGTTEQALTLRHEILLKHVVSLWQHRKRTKAKEFFLQYVFKNHIIMDAHSGEIQLRELNCLELERFLFNSLVKLLPQILPNEPELIDRDISCLRWIILWNKKNPKDKILVGNYPGLIDSFDMALQKYTSDYIFADIFKYFTCTVLVDPAVEHLTELFFTLGLKLYPDLPTILWHLEHNRGLCLRYRTNILNALFGLHGKKIDVWNYLKRNNYLKMVTSFCIPKLVEDPFLKDMYIALACMMDRDEFLDWTGICSRLIAKQAIYRPRDCRSAKVALTKSLKYTKCVSVLPRLLSLRSNYNIGHIFDSLLYIFLHTKQFCLEKLHWMFQDLGLHRICWSVQIEDLNSVCNSLMSFLKRRPEPKEARHIFKAVKYYFKNHPSDTLYQLLVNINLHDYHSDSEGFFRKGLVETVFIFCFFKVAFTGKYLLKIAESMKYLDPDGFATLLSIFAEENDIMYQTPFQSASYIVQNYFLVNDWHFCDLILKRFVAQFICYCSYDPVSKFRLVISKLSAFLIANEYNKSVTDDIQITLYYVLIKLSEVLRNNQACHFTGEVVVPGIPLLEAFKSCWPDYWPMETFQSAYTKLETLLAIYKSNDIEERGRNISNMLDDIAQTFGTDVFEIVELSILQFLTRNSVEEMDREIVPFCSAIFNYRQSPNSALLILRILPKGPVHVSSKDKYNDLLETLSLQTDEVVVRAFQEFLRGRSIDAP